MMPAQRGHPGTAGYRTPSPKPGNTGSLQGQHCWTHKKKRIDSKNFEKQPGAIQEVFKNRSQLKIQHPKVLSGGPAGAKDRLVQLPVSIQGLGHRSGYGILFTAIHAAEL